MNAHSILVDNLLLALGQKENAHLGNFWKQATGGVELPDGGFLQYGVVGGGDISGILRCGCRGELECKTGKGVQIKTQKDFEKVINENSGFYRVVRDIPSVLAEIEAHVKKCPKRNPF